ncbi:MAG TPA: hypothetical protein VI874_02860, partial [Candidatus Norongarragalinales archaeon]|nr:hypothetical protein [Candidatus Norongarragalinales archaeon]
LPVDARFILPGGKIKQNPDGSTSALIGRGEIILFSSGATANANEAALPHGIPVVMNSYRIRNIRDGWALSFPTPVLLSLPAEADKEQLQNGQVQVTLQSAQILLPIGAQVTLPQAGLVQRTAVEAYIPPEQPVEFRRVPFHAESALNLLPPGATEITLPVDAQLSIPTGTLERSKQTFASSLPSRIASDNLQNLKAIQLPGGERLAFGPDAGIALDQRQVRVPANTPIFVAKGRVRAVDGLELSQGFELVLPVPFSLSFSTPDAKVAKIQSGRYALRLTEEASVEASFKLSPSKKTSGYELAVPRETPLIFRKGAHARNPVDPASISSCRFSYGSTETVTFTLPEGASLEKSEGGYLATLARCDESSKIKLYATSAFGTPELLESMAAKQVYFPVSAEFVSGDPEKTDEKSIRTTGKIQFVACLKDKEGKELSESFRFLRLSFPDPTFIALPLRAIPSNLKSIAEIDLKKPSSVRLQVKSSPAQDLGSTSKIFIEQNAGHAALAGPPEYPSSGLALSEGASLRFVPSCEKAPRRLDVKSRADDVEVLTQDATNPRLIKVTFSNANPKFSEERRVNLFNHGQ